MVICGDEKVLAERMVNKRNWGHCPDAVAQDIFSATKGAGVAWKVNNECLPPKYRVYNRYVCCMNESNSVSGMSDLFRIVSKFV